MESLARAEHLSAHFTLDEQNDWIAEIACDKALTLGHGFRQGHDGSYEIFSPEAPSQLLQYNPAYVSWFRDPRSGKNHPYVGERALAKHMNRSRTAEACMAFRHAIVQAPLEYLLFDPTSDRSHIWAGYTHASDEFKSRGSIVGVKLAFMPEFTSLIRNANTSRSSELKEDEIFLSSTINWGHLLRFCEAVLRPVDA